MAEDIEFNRMFKLAKTELDSVNSTIPELGFITSKLKRYEIDRDYHENLMSIGSNASVLHPNYKKILKEISELEVLYNQKIKRIEFSINMILQISMFMMSKVIDASIENSEHTSLKAKELFYYGIEIMKNDDIYGKINLNYLIPLMIELDFAARNTENTNEMNVRKRMAILRRYMRYEVRPEL